MSALIDAAFAGEPELPCVGRGAGDVQRGAVPGDQQPERERARGRRRGQRAAAPLEQYLQRLGAQPLPGPGQGRTRGQALHAHARQVPQLLRQRAQNRPISRRPGTVGTAEQAQGQDEVDHGAGRQQTAAALGAATVLHDLVHQPGSDLLGEYAETDVLTERLSRRHQFDGQQAILACKVGGRRASNDTLSAQRSSLADSRILVGLSVLPGTPLPRPGLRVSVTGSDEPRNATRGQIRLNSPSVSL